MTAYHSISQAVREMSLRRTTMRRRCWVAAIMAGAVFWVGPISAALATAEVDRSPVDLALSPDEAWLITVNQTSDSVSLVDVAEGKVVGELSCGHHPSAVALAADGRVVVTGTYSGTLDLFELSDGRLTADGSIAVGSHPVGVAISADGRGPLAALPGLVARWQSPGGRYQRRPERFRGRYRIECNAVSGTSARLEPGPPGG